MLHSVVVPPPPSPTHTLKHTYVLLTQHDKIGVHKTLRQRRLFDSSTLALVPTTITTTIARKCLIDIKIQQKY